jgi:hypothetical protein
MKNFITRKLENDFGAVLIFFVVVLVVISTATVSIVDRQIEANKIKQDRIDKELREIGAKAAYEQCLLDASSDYVTNWDGQCEGRGEEKDCLLPTSLAESVNETLKTEQKACLDIYKLELNQ